MHFCIKHLKTRCNNDVHRIAIVRFQIVYASLSAFRFSTFLLQLNWFFFSKKNIQEFQFEYTNELGKRTTMEERYIMWWWWWWWRWRCLCRCVAHSIYKRIILYDVCLFFPSFFFFPDLVVCLRACVRAYVCVCVCASVVFIGAHTALSCSTFDTEWKPKEY